MSAQYSPASAFHTSVFALNNLHHHQQSHAAMSLPTQQYQHFLGSSAHALSTSALDLCVRKRRHQSPTPVSPPRTDYQPPTPPSPCHVMLPTALEIKPLTHDQNDSSMASLMDVPSSTSNITCYSSPRSNSCRSDDSSESLDICGNDGASDLQLMENVQVSTSKANKVKMPRPFKAYPKDPLSLGFGVSSATAGGCTTEGLLGLGALGNGLESGTDAYSEFRNRMMRHVQANYSHGTNKNMRRTGNSSSPTCSLSSGPSNSDMKYLEMRRKNNEAAKRSRDARRAKEDEIAIRCAFLEQENLKLRYELASVKSETERLRGILAYSS